MVSDRPHLPGARLGPGLARLEEAAARVVAALGREADYVELAALQPADVLLDLYGEDIRARAFVTADDGAEMMLRPDFTVPIVRLHMETGRARGAYAYCGPVWRRQDGGSDQGREYLQAGVELFGGADAAAADAEALRRILDALGDAPVELVVGDLGLPLAVIDALDTPAARKAALRRHLWRPARFHVMLERYGARHAEVTAGRAGLLAAIAAGGAEALVAGAGAPVGARGEDEVLDRLARLRVEAGTPPLDPRAVAGLEAVLAVAGPAPAALARLREIAVDLPGLTPAAERLDARLEAIAARGVEPATLRFEGSFGRTTLEYYDGFVFGAVARGRADLPPIASGGRYDTLTRILGGGRGVPAVGGIVRPEALLALSEAEA
ncbi:ATP phosphoribosyltransferase regulatory subunit [Amaricoccus sp.]|uniref:ATP phosphoribosyltransferase regulatory subunit n=1 Tax=Amaricoccus sp. TaxID=1872485 RepID=UPI001B7B0635|nr:ATP phosphoribosyltransferase regulatory subunit [Amaricoccus sp.]MBP7000222.1 ATP phosphoribosyltransferase regulatory subunit [Amaricoccus sp.]